MWLSSAAAEFFATYLTGAGEVDRYIAPGVTLSPVSPAPYTAVSVEQVSAAEEAAAAEKMPVDGTAVRVLARVEARDVGGRWRTSSRSRPAQAGGKLPRRSPGPPRTGVPGEHDALPDARRASLANMSEDEVKNPAKGCTPSPASSSTSTRFP
ncbi:hypothetical protein ACIREM_23090 [Streptomyces shenzhenensis]|uniref:hypothetical protein n=1 Tax=Streptomyces shenzhenensis TaxID=943815 RepID=UPI0037FEDE1D